MGDYIHGKPQGYDAQQVLLDAGSVSANITVAVGASNAVKIGTNVELEIVAQVRGTVTGTSPTLDLKIQESADGVSSFTDVQSGAISQFTTAGEKRVRVRTTKPYVSVVGTVGGTTPVFPDTEVFIASPG